MPNAPFSFAWLYPVVFVLALIVLAFGIYFAADGQWTLLAAGCVCVVVVLTGWPLAIGLLRARSEREETLRQAMKSVEERLEGFSVMLNLISEQQLISDRAKSIAFRTRDREAVRHAIHEEINRQDWEAALVLANEMETAFGYVQEANTLRQQIEERRSEVVKRQIGEAVAVIERHMRAEQWTLAHREADRLGALFPNSDQVRNLHSEIENRRQQRKQQLLEDWNAAVTRKDIDGSISILKTLDSYLTPQEAEGLQDVARNVFREKLQKLRTQFTVAVQDHDWSEAVRVGDAIIRDFPNTQMAREVRDKIDLLRQRASGVEQPAEV